MNSQQQINNLSYSDKVGSYTSQTNGYQNQAHAQMSYTSQPNLTSYSTQPAASYSTQPGPTSYVAQPGATSYSAQPGATIYSAKDGASYTTQVPSYSTQPEASAANSYQTAYSIPTFNYDYSMPYSEPAYTFTYDAPSLNTVQPSDPALLTQFQSLSFTPAPAAAVPSTIETRGISKRRAPSPKPVRQSISLTEIYQYQNQIDENIVCDICLCESWDPTDAIVVCETCLVAVHQSCYAKDIKTSIPTTEWNCERCAYIKTKKSNDYSCAQCRLCKKHEGALTRVGKLWYHIQCVNWAMEIWFEDEDKKDKIAGTPGKRSKCEFCTKDGVLCVKCDMGGCNKKFCVRCAVKQGVIKDDDEMDVQRHPQNDELVYLFWAEHRIGGIEMINKGDFSKLMTDVENKEVKKRNCKKERKKKDVKKGAKKIIRSKSNKDAKKSTVKEGKGKTVLENRVNDLEAIIRLLTSQQVSKTATSKAPKQTRNDILSLVTRKGSSQVRKAKWAKKCVKSKQKVRSPLKMVHKSKRQASVDRRRKLPKKSLIKHVEKTVIPKSPEEQNVLALNSMLDQFNTSFNLNESNQKRKSKQKRVENRVEQLQLIKYRMSQDLKKILKFRSDVAGKDEIHRKIVEIAKSRGAIDMQNQHYTMLFKFPELQAIIGGDIWETSELIPKLMLTNRLTVVNESISANPITLNIKKQAKKAPAKRAKKTQDKTVEQAVVSQPASYYDPYQQESTVSDYSFQQSIPFDLALQQTNQTATQFPQGNIDWNELLNNPMIQGLIRQQNAV